MMDEMDSGSLFDHIDDLVGFPSDNGCGAGNELCATTAGGGCKDFPSIWGGDESLPDAYPLFPGINRVAASELSVQLSVPYEDIMHLEWLSTFMEDSFSCEGMTLSKNQISVVNNTSHDHFHISSPVSVLESSNNNSNSSNNSSSASVVKYTSLTPTHQAPPHRARSKRPRPTTFNPRPMTQFILDQNPKKSKPKVPLSLVLVEEKTDTQILRKCMHCEVTKTPQWRTGPMGPKTLCNACGVRYKSGRLFPEYRPAASPTFVPSLHSNSRKKVEQMRNNVVLEKELDLTQ